MVFLKEFFITVDFEKDQQTTKKKKKKKKKNMQNYPVGKELKQSQGSHRLEKFLNLEDFLEKSLNIKSVLKSTGTSSKSLEKSLNSTIFCRT